MVLSSKARLSVIPAIRYKLQATTVDGVNVLIFGFYTQVGHIYIQFWCLYY